MPTQEKIVRTQEKGLITIPAEFREKLGIQKDSLLQAKLTDEGILFVKLHVENEENFFTEEEIKEWMEEDKLDVRTFQKLNKLLGKKK